MPSSWPCGAGPPHQPPPPPPQGPQKPKEDLQPRPSPQANPPTMSRRGDCWDNSALESFFGFPKEGRVLRETPPGRTEARANILVNMGRSTIPGVDIQRLAKTIRGFERNSCGLGVVSENRGNSTDAALCSGPPAAPTHPISLSGPSRHAVVRHLAGTAQSWNCVGPTCVAGRSDMAEKSSAVRWRNSVAPCASASRNGVTQCSDLA